MTAIVASSGFVQNVAQSTSLAARSGVLQTRQWLDRRRGMKLLKELPTGLEALVFGDEISPEMLAALYIGGKAGLELATLALLITMESSPSFDSYHSRVFEPHLYHILGEEAELLSTDAAVPPTRMDGDIHDVELLDWYGKKRIRVHPCSTQTYLSLHENGYLVVMGYAENPDGVVACGATDSRFYYCENRSGHLECSSIDTYPPGGGDLDATCTNSQSRVFTVTAETLESYPEFFRMCRLCTVRRLGVRELLGLTELARSLGRSFAEEITGGSSETLLSREHLRNVHTSVANGCRPLQMPKYIWELVDDAVKALPVGDRKYERACFRPTRDTTAAYVEVIKTLAETPGSVGVRATVSGHSSLVRCCLVGALGLDSSFAIFPRFSNSRVNIEVSPGCTAIYFPGLNITVAFPDGSATQAEERRAFRPSCPFTSELSETIRILVDLAPRIAKGRLRNVAVVLSKELASDPSLVLDPVTENVVRSFATSVDETPAEHSLITLLGTSSLGEGRLHREAALAGVLCQLGLNFVVAGGSDMRCFFDCCLEAGWGTPRGNVGVVLVDCKIDISGCRLFSSPKGLFVGTRGTTGVGYNAKLIGPGLEGPRYRIQRGGNYHLASTAAEVTGNPFPTPPPGKCYVGSSRTP